MNVEQSRMPQKKQIDLYYSPTTLRLPGQMLLASPVSNSGRSKEIQKRLRNHSQLSSKQKREPSLEFETPLISLRRFRMAKPRIPKAKSGQVKQNHACSLSKALS
jgi:hypothetical protein